MTVADKRTRKIAHPILLMEMNEIPWRVVDLYKADPRFPNLGRFFSQAGTYTTMAVDEGELSPWITWPSLHRGMSNLEHKVKNLGQDPRSFQGKALWEEYLVRGHSIGICGSLQSWPPVDPGRGGFYIPDTFAHDERCIPSYVEPFQKFNLDQVRKNGRVVGSGGSFGLRALSILASFPRLGIRPSTVAKVLGQLLGERKNPDRKARRPVFQSVLLWDIFRKLYSPAEPPAFATFFTNHVAGVMHRYWHHVFPEDYGDKYRSQPAVHKATMDFAMKLVDEMLGEALSWTRRNPGLIVAFATSMGQAAVHRDSHEGIEASISDLDALMRFCGLSSGDFQPLLAMVPQVAVKVASGQSRRSVKDALEGARSHSGKAFFAVEEIGDSLSITVGTPPLADVRTGTFLRHRPGSAQPGTAAWEDAGIKMNEVEPGTAYHIPEGVLAVYREGVQGSDTRSSLKASEVKEFLMGIAGIAMATKTSSRAGSGVEI
jgi:hypothetical protein